MSVLSNCIFKTNLAATPETSQMLVTSGAALRPLQLSTVFVALKTPPLSIHRGK